jgi:hypothetical protein
MTDVQDFELKHGGTVLFVHVYVHCCQDIRKLQMAAIRAAKGPRLDAICVWTELHAPGRVGWEVEKFPVSQRQQVEAFLKASPVDVVKLHLAVNTDADPQRLSQNIQRAARGPRLDAVLIVVEQYDGAEGRKIWDIVQGAVQKAAADPKAVSFSLE